MAANTGRTLFEAGVIPGDAPFNSYCASGDSPHLKRCKGVLDKARLHHALLFECQGKGWCVLQDLGKYINKAFAKAQPTCFDDDSVLFAQAACTIPSDDLASRKECALALGCVGVFLALFVLNYFDYMKQVAELGFVEWDVKTITAGDYTVEFNLDETFYDDYIEKELDDWIEESLAEGREYLSKLQSFQFWIQRQMERRLLQTPSLGYEDTDDCVEVAVTTMAFKNEKIINLLRKRGDCIKTEQWDKQRELDRQINDLKEKEFKRLITPCSVFMTFETEEGYNRALQLGEAIRAQPRLAHLNDWCGGHSIEIKPASEPSDIVWENR